MTPARYQSGIVTAAVLLAALAAASDEDACQMAQQAFSDCVPYVMGEEPAVTQHCCTGLADLRFMADTAAQRRALCACILSEVKAAGKMAPGRAAGLHASCKVPVGFMPTKPDFDCSAVS